MTGRILIFNSYEKELPLLFCFILMQNGIFLLAELKREFEEVKALILIF